MSQNRTLSRDRPSFRKSGRLVDSLCERRRSAAIETHSEGRIPASELPQDLDHMTSAVANASITGQNMDLSWRTAQQSAVRIAFTHRDRKGTRVTAGGGGELSSFSDRKLTTAQRLCAVGAHWVIGTPVTKQVATGTQNPDEGMSS